MTFKVNFFKKLEKSVQPKDNRITYLKILEKLDEKESKVLNDYVNHKIRLILERNKKMHVIVYYYLMLIITILNFILIIILLPLLILLQKSLILLVIALIALIIGIVFNYFVSQVEQINKRQYLFATLIFFITTILAFIISYYTNYTLITVEIKKRFYVSLITYIIFFLLPYPFFEIINRLTSLTRKR